MKKTKKLLGIILALALIASSVYVGGIMSISAAGEESTANLNVSSDKSIPDTDSDRDGYWDITTPDELTFALSADGSGKNYELLCDIYLNDISKVNWSGGTIDASSVSELSLGTAVSFSDITLKFADSARIYACGNRVTVDETATVDGTATVSFNAKAMSIYGGSRSGAVNTCDTVINMNGGWVHQIFGGSENISLTGDTLVNLNGGTVQRRVFGGCYNGFDTSGWAGTAHVTGTTTLRVTSAMSFPFDEISYPDDTGITAKSRAEDVNDDEIAVMIFDSEATKTALEADGRLGVAVNIILASFEIAAYDSYSIG